MQKLSPLKIGGIRKAKSAPGQNNIVSFCSFCFSFLSLCLPGGHDVGRATKPGQKFLGFGVNVVLGACRFVVDVLWCVVPRAQLSWTWSLFFISAPGPLPTRTPHPHRILQNICLKNMRCSCGGVEFPLLPLNLYIY